MRRKRNLIKKDTKLKYI